MGNPAQRDVSPWADVSSEAGNLLSALIRNQNPCFEMASNNYCGVRYIHIRYMHLDTGGLLRHRFTHLKLPLAVFKSRFGCRVTSDTVISWHS